MKSLNSALREEAIGERELDLFIRRLLGALVPGEQFRFQMTLAGIAAACETINKAFARQFIDYLAGIQLSELSVAAAVAKYGQRSITKTVSRTFSCSSPQSQFGFVQRVTKADVGQRSQTFEEEFV